MASCRDARARVRISWSDHRYVLPLPQNPVRMYQIYDLHGGIINTPFMNQAAMFEITELAIWEVRCESVLLPAEGYDITGVVQVFLTASTDHLYEHGLYRLVMLLAYE
jgi:hypothetical protein